MPDSHRHNHWRSLAEMLGAELPPEPPPAAEALPPVEEPLPELPSFAASEPVAAAPAEPPFATAPASPPASSSPATPPSAPPPAARPPRAHAGKRSSWDDLAVQLGLMPTPEPDDQFGEAADVEMPVEPEVEARQPEVIEPELIDEEPAAGRGPVAEYEVTEFNIKPARGKDRWREHRGEVNAADDDEQDEDIEVGVSWDELGVAGDEDVEGLEEDEPVLEALVDDELEGSDDEVEAAEETEGQRPRRRRRRRRRGRGRKERSVRDEADTEAEAETDEEEVDEPVLRERPSAAARDRVPPRERREEEEDTELDVEDIELVEDEPYHERDADDDLEEYDDDGDDVARPKHTKIPTWEHAIGMIVETNMAARARQPHGGRQHGSGRPRGRGRGPRR